MVLTSRNMIPSLHLNKIYYISLIKIYKHNILIIRKKSLNLPKLTASLSRNEVISKIFIFHHPFFKSNSNKNEEYSVLQESESI